MIASPPPAARHVHVEQVMGTAVSFDVRLESGSASAQVDAEDSVSAAVEWLHWVDVTFTTYHATSVIRRLGRGELALSECPEPVREVVGLCELYRDRTDGWFDPWAGPAGFDPSGLVKGWAAQRASDLLTERGCVRHCVNAGGDVVVRGGRRPWRIGVVDALDAQRLRLVVPVQDEAVATSGTGQRGHHVWRRDGSPARELAAVTVLDPDLTRADVLATAALAMGERAVPWLADQVQDAHVTRSDGTEWMTESFRRRCSATG